MYSRPKQTILEAEGEAAKLKHQKVTPFLNLLYLFARVFLSFLFLYADFFFSIY